MAETDTGERDWKDRRFAAVWTGLYAIVVLLGMLRHELWRDEYQAWLFARDSASLRELFSHLRYEGHPPLWHLMLYVITRFTEQPMAMQMLHLSIVTGTVWLVLRHAPFGRVFRLAFCFGYYMLYEYAVLSRNYALGLFFAVWFCIRYRDRVRPGMELGLILALMALSNPFATMLSLALLAFLAVDRLATSKPPFVRFERGTVLTLGLGLSGVGLALWRILPPADGGFFDFEAIPGGFHAESLSQALSHVFTSYVPIPQSGIANWNTNWVAGWGGPWVLLGSLLILVLSVIVLLQNHRALLFYLMATGGYLIYFHLFAMAPQHLRYTGHLFLVLIMSLWLSRTLAARRTHPWPHGAGRAGAAIERPFIAILLAAQIWGGIVLYANDWRHPFTHNKAAAAFLVESGYDSSAMVGSQDFMVLPFAAIFNRQMYYPEREGLGSFVVWDQKRRRPITPGMILAPCPDLFRQTGKAVLLILSAEMTKTVDGKILPIREEPLGDGFQFSFLKDFAGPSICGDGKYYIYKFDRVADSAGMEE